jgi:hypothetical protein
MPRDLLSRVKDSSLFFSERELREIPLSQASDVNAQREEWLNHMRADWYRVMRPLGAWLPWDLSEKMVLKEVEREEDYFQPALAAQMAPRPQLQSCSRSLCALGKLFAS